MSPVSRNSFAKLDPIPGAIAPTGYPYGTTTGVLTASRSYYGRFVPTRSMTITKIAFVTTVAATNNDNVDVGIYNAAGERLASSGATAGVLNATAGVQAITITSTPLAAGAVYYAGLACGTVGGTAATLVLNTISTNFSSIFSASLPNALQAIQASATLGTTITPTASGSVPVLALRES